MDTKDDLSSPFCDQQQRSAIPTTWTHKAGDDSFEMDSYSEFCSSEDDPPILNHENIIGSDINKDFKKQKVGREEKLRMRAIRKRNNLLSEKVQRKENEVHRIRDELRKCRTNIEILELERNHVFGQIEKCYTEGNMAKVYLLQSKQEKLNLEYKAEENLEKQVIIRLDNAEYELSEIELEQGKCIMFENELTTQEKRFEIEATEEAIHRMKKDILQTQKCEKRKKNTERDQLVALQEKDRICQQVLNVAKRSQQVTNKYLQDTLQRVKQVEENESDCSLIDKRVNTLLKLRTDIATNRDNIGAIQSRESYLKQKALGQTLKDRNEIVDNGGNASAVIVKKKRLQELEKDIEEYEVDQKQKQAELISRILSEESQIKKHQTMYPQLWPNSKIGQMETAVVGSVKNSVAAEGHNLKEYSPSKKKLENGCIGIDSFEMSLAKEVTLHDENIKSEPMDCNNLADDSDESEDNSLATPEFSGLWNNNDKIYKAPKVEKLSYTSNYQSKKETERTTQAINKHKSVIVKKQTALGKGCPFNSKPDVIDFKDFDVLKTYKKKVILTNVSYSVNFLKYINLSPHLKDFFEILFNPPGQMSAGMSCEMYITFKPMVNEDLKGVISFLAQTGPFVVPIQCTKKKCNLSVDCDYIDFGNQVIGENLKKSITLTNKGAKGTSFKFLRTSGLRQTPTSAGTSLGGFTSIEKSQSNVLDKHLKHSISDPESASKTEDCQGTVELGDLDGMGVGKTTEGILEPFSSVKLEIIYNPSISGRVETEFEIHFDDQDSSVISVKSIAYAIDVPVWVKHGNIDLNICMVDRLYQDAVIVNNRATTSLRLTFEVCKELQSHLELLPKTGYIQAQSQFSAQLKFFPRKSIFDEGGKYFDKETGVLEAPMTIRVADQTSAVHFTLHAVVTVTDFELNPNNIDFGYCTINESVIAKINLTNKSVLSQKFGFVNLPDYVDVQPNDGFGTMLPLESIELDVIFKPKKAAVYSFELTCRSGINRDFKIRCKGIGVHPPITISNSIIHFPATALGDSSTATIDIINSHKSANEFTHLVPRIGNGSVFPVGPISFEFCIPKDAPLEISPSIGTIDVGSRKKISVRFNPMLTDTDIQHEAVNIVTKSLKAQVQKEVQEAKLLAQKNVIEPSEQKGKKSTKKTGIKSASNKGRGGRTSSGVLLSVLPKDVILPVPEDIQSSSNDYSLARTSLYRQFINSFSSYSIPCFVATGTPAYPATLPYSVHNTLYLEVHCPTIKPPIVVISNNGQTILDFDDVSIGQRIIKSITIQNISHIVQDLTSSVLDTCGPFQLLNAIRSLPPNATHTLLIAFSPKIAKVFVEVLNIKCVTSTLCVSLNGQGMQPLVSTSLEDDLLNFGYVIVGENLTESFKMENKSTLSVDYCIRLLSNLSHEFHDNMKQQLPYFVDGDNSIGKVMGSSNCSGRNVFDCVPSAGTLKPGATQDIFVTFFPDHTSNFFFDCAQIELCNKNEDHKIYLKGCANPHTMYVVGGDDIYSGMESFTAVLKSEEISDEKLKNPDVPVIPLLLTFYAISKGDVIIPAKRDIQVGCIRNNSFSQKKNGEFYFDPLNAIPKGFQIDLQRGMVEAGQTKTITFTWTPPRGHNPNTCIGGSLCLNLKGDILEKYEITLQTKLLSE
ncbi:cilia- and flagella-associated protein 74-like isoform X2 [Antedon mediterranea]|uniref:cilia- and flagella-associated protein 74-like isoform X2 n=1 Tax=Antedon mediterranea TaxID=105859 RepID=UPI003AF463AE